MKAIAVETKKEKEVVDITDLLNKNLPKKTGICHLFLEHTTAALSTAALDPGSDLDLLDALEKNVPNIKYRHDPQRPKHAPSHILSSLVGTSLALPFEYGELVLGEWQRVILVEFAGPRTRKIVISPILDSEG